MVRIIFSSPGSVYCKRGSQTFQITNSFVVQDCTYVFEFLSMQMEKMEKTDEITYMIQTLSKTFPTLLETLVQERDQYMVASLRSVARQSTSVVAVVGRGHLAGIAANWEQDIAVSLDLPIMPLHSLSYISHWNA
jgi:pheromone shutdown protein TraB